MMLCILDNHIYSCFYTIIKKKTKKVKSGQINEILRNHGQRIT